MKRKMMLKSAQVTSLQQRELSMQKKLYQSLYKFTQNVTFQLSEAHPTEDFNLPELLHLTGAYLDDIIRFDQNFSSGRRDQGKSRLAAASSSLHSSKAGRSNHSSSLKLSEASHGWENAVFDSHGGGATYEYPVNDERSPPVDDINVVRTSASRIPARLSPSRPAPKKPTH
jgi:hypothetical protein